MLHKVEVLVRAEVLFEQPEAAAARANAELRIQRQNHQMRDPAGAQFVGALNSRARARVFAASWRRTGMRNLPSDMSANAAAQSGRGTYRSRLMSSSVSSVNGFQYRMATYTFAACPLSSSDRRNASAWRGEAPRHQQGECLDRPFASLGAPMKIAPARLSPCAAANPRRWPRTLPCSAKCPRKPVETLSRNQSAVFRSCTRSRVDFASLRGGNGGMSLHTFGARSDEMTVARGFWRNLTGGGRRMMSGSAKRL